MIPSYGFFLDLQPQVSHIDYPLPVKTGIPGPK